MERDVLGVKDYALFLDAEIHELKILNLHDLSANLSTQLFSCRNRNEHLKLEITWKNNVWNTWVSTFRT